MDLLVEVRQRRSFYSEKLKKNKTTKRRSPFCLKEKSLNVNDIQI